MKALAFALTMGVLVTSSVTAATQQASKSQLTAEENECLRQRKGAESDNGYPVTGVFAYKLPQQPRYLICHVEYSKESWDKGHESLSFVLESGRHIASWNNNGPLLVDPVRGVQFGPGNDAYLASNVTGDVAKRSDAKIWLNYCPNLGRISFSCPKFSLAAALEKYFISDEFRITDFTEGAKSALAVVFIGEQIKLLTIQAGGQVNELLEGSDQINIDNITLSSWGEMKDQKRLLKSISHMSNQGTKIHFYSAHVFDTKTGKISNLMQVGFGNNRALDILMEPVQNGAFVDIKFNQWEDSKAVFNATFYAENCSEEKAKSLLEQAGGSLAFFNFRFKPAANGAYQAISCDVKVRKR